MLERSAVKVASCVLMGERDREVSDLPDILFDKEKSLRNYIRDYDQ